MDRLREEPCGCRTDSQTGITTQFCHHHLLVQTVERIEEWVLDDDNRAVAMGDEMGQVAELLRENLERLDQAQPTLVIEMSGGLVDSCYASENMKLIILDYDTDFVTDGDQVIEDAEGRTLFPRLFDVGTAPVSLAAAEKLVAGVDMEEQPQ